MCFDRFWLQVDPRISWDTRYPGISWDIPGINAKVNELLGLPPTESWDGVLDWGTTLEGNQLGGKAILFPRA